MQAKIAQMRRVFFEELRVTSTVMILQIIALIL